MTLLIVTLLIFVLLANSGKGRGNARGLSRRFQALGNMYGKSKDQIVEAVGEPTSVSFIGRAKLMQWQVPGYHIALRFDEDDMFAGITHEYAARR
jgi:hypothetical protein